MGFELNPVLPELFLLLAGLALLVVGVLMQAGEAPRVVATLSVLALLIAGIIVAASDRAPQLALGGHYIADGFSAFLKILLFVGAALAILLAQGFLQDRRIDRFEYALLVLFSTLGMSMMVSANSFLALYMGLELSALPLYVLAAFDRDSLRSTEAGLKYFVLGALASGLLLYGCSLVYGFTGTLSFDVLAGTFGAATADRPPAPLPLGAVVGLVFIIAGLAFKLAAVPFHMWTPDVYEGSPTPVTAFLATASKVAAAGLAVRVLMQPFGDWTAQWQQVVVLIAIASMLLGAFAAIGQTHIKRLMAYSGIGHIGYALVGVAAGSERGVYAVLVYLAIYLVMTLGTFGCILLMRRQGQYVEQIGDLAGLSRQRPMAAAALGVFMFSQAGIPPLAGFFGKLLVFLAAVEAGLTWLAVLGVLSSCVAAFYYLRIVKVMYFDEAAEPLDTAVHPAVMGITGVTALATLLFIVWPGPLLRAAGAAAAALVR